MKMAAGGKALKSRWLEMSQDKKGDTEGMKKLLEENKSFDVDCLDKTGMTALQHAAFRGNVELCEILLARGANVNSDKHENRYTALMFGALSGNAAVVNILLDAGAKCDTKNTVNRTAAEMAAFVAHYHIGGVIQNFLPSKDLQKFAKKSGKETRPKLKKEFLKPFHSFISEFNLHPIHLVRELYKTPGLLDDSKYLREILDKLILEKMLPHDTNESQALKFHYLSCIIEQTAKARTTPKDDDGKAFIKKLATGRASDGFLEQVEQLIRSTLGSYPKPESMLFLMLVKKLSDVEIGHQPTALVALTDSINGNTMKTGEEQVCFVCASRDPKQCKRCRRAFYCPAPATCQKTHWPTHKKYCKEPKPIEDI